MINECVNNIEAYITFLLILTLLLQSFIAVKQHKLKERIKELALAIEEE